MQVLGVSGSLRPHSFNLRLLLAASSSLPPGVRLDVYDGLGDIPPYRDDTSTLPSVDRLLVALACADAVLIATPEYNSSVPGQLKNALDWVSRPFPDNVLRRKPVAVVGASTGLFGAVWAQAELRKVLSAIGASVVDEELPIGQADDAFDDDGALVDPELQARLGDIVSRLLARVPMVAAGDAVG